MTPQRAGIVTAAGAFALDQLSKNALLYAAHFYVQPNQCHYVSGRALNVTPFFDIVMVWNCGISYGLFKATGLLGTVLLAVFSLAAVAALSWWLSRAETRFLGLGLGLIVGGALGNVVDRVIYGAVADFFDFHAFGHHWYVFNIADAAITVGVLVLIADAFVRGETRDPAKRE